MQPQEVGVSPAARLPVVGSLVLFEVVREGNASDIERERKKDKERRVSLPSIKSKKLIVLPAGEVVELCRNDRKNLILKSRLLIG